jgi:hypothetical protein
MQPAPTSTQRYIGTVPLGLRYVFTAFATAMAVLEPFFQKGAAKTRQCSVVLWQLWSRDGDIDDYERRRKQDWKYVFDCRTHFVGQNSSPREKERTNHNFVRTFLYLLI